MAQFTITNPAGGSPVPLESLGLTVASGELLTMGADTVRLIADEDFDAADVFAYRDAVTIFRDGVPWFSGAVTNLESEATGEDESKGMTITGPWADLEETIYQQNWKVGGGTVLLPKAILNMFESGAPARLDQQIAGVITFAAANGVAIQVGTIDEAPTIWPVEAKNTSCAEVIRQCMRWTPQRVAWLDYSTTPPTFHCRARANLTAINIAADGSGGLDALKVIPRNDLVPESVRICYMSAASIDGQVFRSVAIDKFPADGPDSGPRVMSAEIELAGMQAQRQVEQVGVNAFPTAGSEVLPWLSRKYPEIDGIKDDLKITAYEMTLAPDEVPPEEQPPALNAETARITAATVADLPNELVYGKIHDWMRVRWGSVRIRVTVEYDDQDGEEPVIPEDVIEVLGSTGKKVLDMTMTGTNATNRTYRGLASWSPPDQAPTGIAQAIFEGLNDLQYEGSATLELDELPAVLQAGRVINITGSDNSDLATMRALVSAVAFDIENREIAYDFGPAAHLGPQDFLELQRMVRTNPPKWYSTEERDSDTLGGDGKPSADGDTVGGYAFPKTTVFPGSGGGFPVDRLNLRFLCVSTQIYGDTSEIEYSSASSPYVIRITPEGIFFGWPPGTDSAITGSGIDPEVLTLDIVGRVGGTGSTESGPGITEPTP